VAIPSQPTFQTSSGPLKIKQEVAEVKCVSSPIDVEATRNSKKRKDAELTAGLSRDELIKLSSKGSDHADDKTMKRQKRLIKNRESAQLSRLRKKLYIEELERKVTHLTTDNESLGKQVNSLNGDKKRLQEEVVYLQSIIKQSPELSAALATRKAPFQPKNVKAAGVCLLIILFSVGLLFNQSKSTFPLSRISREEIPEVIPKSTLYTGRILKSVSEDLTEDFKPSKESVEVVPVSKSQKMDENEETKAIVPIPLKVKEIGLKERKHPRDTDDEVVFVKGESKNEPAKRKRMKISDENVAEDSSKGLVPADASAAKQNTEIVPRRNPNASYIYCPEAVHVAPSISSSESPEIVALLLPASVLNGTLFGNMANLDSSMLEVSCQVLNLHMWPLNNNSVPRR